MLEILDEQCTGCTMCGQLCPTGAIQFEIKDGFRYPKVVRNKCINCDLCNKRCPAKNNNIEKNRIFQKYTLEGETMKNKESIVPLAVYYLNYQNSSWKTMVMLQG